MCVCVCVHSCVHGPTLRLTTAVGFAGPGVQGAVHLVAAEQLAGGLGQVTMGRVAAVHRPLVEQEPEADKGGGLLV